MYVVNNGLRRHKLSVAGFIVLWTGVWLVTVLTWETDAVGYSIGMSPAAIPLHLLAPLVLGVLVSFWWDWSIPGPWRTHILFGLGFSAIHLLVLWLADWLWIPSTETAMATTDLVAQAGVVAVLYGSLSLALITVAGWLAALFMRRAGTGPPKTPDRPT